MNRSVLFFFLSFYIGFISVSGQDSLSLFPKSYNQYNEERIQTTNFYYNPATMPGYSAYSISEFSTDYVSDNQKIYLRQMGSGDSGLRIRTRSFNKLKSGNVVWGVASYSNMTRKRPRYNENLDFERIAPYVTSDSVGGDLKLEDYHFSGGFAKTINRFSFGLSGSYDAELAYRSRDPRVRNTSSDLILSAGISYKIYKSYKIGVFGEFNKYTQNSSVSLVNEVSYPIVYQSVGFGYTNYLFHNSLTTQYEEFGYRAGAQISSKDGKDFYITGMFLNSNNIKSIYPKNGNRYYDSSDLENKTYLLEAAKFISLKNNRIGFIINYNSKIRTGEEYGYTSNSDRMEQIFKRKAYKKEEYTTSVRALYQLTKEKYIFSAVPFFSYQEVTERRLYPFSGQKYDAYTIGLEMDIKLEINKNRVLTLRPVYSYRKINNAINALDSNVSAANLEWISDDFTILTSNIETTGATIRYDFKMAKFPPIFVSGQWITSIIKQQSNNFGVFSLGITF
ncbi:DUF6850 family outer membrane beta-barrel protein [Epilithonimonas sp.]|uniref:DUF6850 family outer membrane beta-barrel protein n=1 Tax=Epilithonimonas sp. TaxID=2894511 RepID=UPI0035B49995